jgi:hypothetical protein
MIGLGEFFFFFQQVVVSAFGDGAVFCSSPCSG